MSTDKTIVVTGASRGIGLGIVRAAHARGIRVAACARSPIDAPAEVLTAIVDVTDEAAVEAFAEQAFARFGRVDGWINNAGILGPIRFGHDLDVAAFRSVMDVNVTGVFLGSRAFARRARTQGGGVLINLSSGAAQRPVPGWSAYCASKAAVERFSEVVQAEEGGHGLRVFSVAPGVVDTEMQSTIRAASPDDFPPLERFLQLKKDDAFNSLEHVADVLLSLIFEPARRPETVAWRVEAP